MGKDDKKAPFKNAEESNLLSGTGNLKHPFKRKIPVLGNPLKLSTNLSVTPMTHRLGDVVEFLHFTKVLSYDRTLLWLGRPD